jgi:hypothetical protein
LKMTNFTITIIVIWDFIYSGFSCP